MRGKRWMGEQWEVEGPTYLGGTSRAVGHRLLKVAVDRVLKVCGTIGGGRVL